MDINSGNKLKCFKLKLHQKTFSDEDLIINQKDYPEARKNDILEIYHPSPEEENQKKNKYDSEEENPRLLLQIKAFSDDLLQTRETISVEQSIASSFGLQTYKNVAITLVNPNDVALDSIELTFKDQYMGRSEMWRLKNSLVNTCAYLNKKIEFCNGAVRCQVYEMWSQGERVACGVITDDTKVVFRSSTSMVYLFLQMSSEMWDFDIYGDLYFEKAVNGFLCDLFTKWKKNGSNHEITIVLFSRTFYKANCLEEFPLYMRECLQKDYKGRFYEDFYRVAVQNERYDDWSLILVQLRRIFQDYLKIVLEYHARDGYTLPLATNSSAAQGNFLEVLNMSLNVFEKHYLDRSFDRTGQLSIVVTPGVGVFEVDRELTNITKQRIIDNGVGSDLVCVGEQPLHAVPLLKFHNKVSHLNIPDDYSMPHWINLSFYSSNKKIAYSKFVPRIKVPPSIVEGTKKESPKTKLLPEEEYIHNTFFDYDAYDAKVFQLPSAHPTTENNAMHHHKIPPRYKRSSGSFLDLQEFPKGQRRKMSDPDITYRHSNNVRSEPIAIPMGTCSPMISPQAEDKELSPPPRMVVGSEGSPPFESKALINPFDPSHVTIKLTSNRRRWTHIFPKGPNGILVQQHHYQVAPPKQDIEKENCDQINATCLSKDYKALAALRDYCRKRPNCQSISANPSEPLKSSTKSCTLLWGATGEQEWTPILTTGCAVSDVLIGVDWKSLTIPACLPITTDYFPDKRALNIDYVVSLYTLLPDSVYADFAQQRSAYKRPLSTVEVFKELISQRLAQGFQMILIDDCNVDLSSSIVIPSSMRGYVLRKSPSENDESYYLSIGRLFHKISLSGNTISVTIYRPRHPYPGFNYQYRYRFHAPWHDNYEESYASFTTEKLEHFNWNHLDHYVCKGGDDTETALLETLKYWRFRVYLLPLNNSATRKILEGAEHCDIYTIPTATENQQMVEGLIKFLEAAVNKIKHSNISKKPRMSLSILGNPPMVQPRRNSMSNFHQKTTVRSIERNIAPSLRSGSKVIDRSRISQGNSEITSDLRETQESSTDENISPPIMLLKPNAGDIEIIEAFRNPINGLSFINPQNNLPNLSFVTAEAVSWLMSHMEGITTVEKAVHIMKHLHKNKMIRHASGDLNKPFINGFYIFYIISTEKDDKEFQPNGNIQMFENEWMEVEVKPPLNWGIPITNVTSEVPMSFSSAEHGVSHFLCDEIDANYSDCDVDGPMYKRMRLETDITNKSDRIEWGHAKYQTIFRPDQAYELVVEWLTSSGSIVSELLFGWHRKAQISGLQMIPVPHDPLALPYSNKSDPLRGPIFIPLHISCLEEKEKLFTEFPEDSYTERLFLFQESILQRFGFIPCQIEPPSTETTSMEHQYIHATGTIFVLISCSMPKKRNRSNANIGLNTGRYSVLADVIPSPHEAYITRHVSGKNKDNYDNSKKMGFLWSWNHMVSRRWRTNQGVDNSFQLKLLKDFREFCKNCDNRLKNFLNECWEAKDSSIALRAGNTRRVSMNAF